MARRVWVCGHVDVQGRKSDVQSRLPTTSLGSLLVHDISLTTLYLISTTPTTMPPTFTIFQDPPSAPSTRSPTRAPLNSASSRPLARLSSSSTSVALVADKENVDPSTGLPRTTAAKPKAKKALSTKNKENSKASAKVPKASRGGSAAAGPAKPTNTLRASPYRPVLSLPVSELAFHLASSSATPKPCLIAGFSASGLSDFAEPEFDLYSDFVDQPSPPRSRPDSMWASELSPTVETAGDRKARDLTELPLADLSEAFATGTKKSIRQKKMLPSNELTLSLFGGASGCLSSSASHTALHMERPFTASADLGITTGFF
ncbi:hypothetical protein RhiJN_04088 [Ceratobasidium sp. AG-Ba]|nr:hypothetical protein RhiJN_04088 [Ceratobasidium sp. AG-Ba]QRW04981.1 hypothetical protein RhiLY_03980 [Ceratobasidium sp. AG-Ba]